MRKTHVKRTLFLGIGNTLLSDEGAGVHALHHVQARNPELQDAEFVDGGTLGFTLLEAIERSNQLIVFDAAQLNVEPGRVRCFEGPAMDEFLGRRHRSVHEIGLVDVLNMARLSGNAPVRRALIAIQPESLGWGATPSAAITRALPKTTQMALQLRARWIGSPSHRHRAVTEHSPPGLGKAGVHDST